MSLRLTHVLSNEFIHIPMLIEEYDFKCAPNWLISLPYLSSKLNFNAFNNRDAFCRTVIDNGGFSAKTKAVSVCDIEPYDLVLALHSHNPFLSFAPDLPIGEFDEQLRNSSNRCELFWKYFNGGTKIFNIVHGSFWKNYEYTVNERQSWLLEMDRRSKRRHRGYAIAGLSKHWSPLEHAMMILHPWAMGKRSQNKSLHILGIGSSKRLPLYFYLQKKFFKWISLDCKTYTIEASRYFNIFFFDEKNEEMRMVSLAKRGNSKKKKKFDANKFSEIDTPIRAYYEIKFQSSLEKLAKGKVENNCSKAERMLREWIPVESVWNVQKYLEFLEKKWCEEGEEKFEDFLRRKDKSFGEAIDFAKKVYKKGRKNYQQLVEEMEIKLDTSRFEEDYFKHYAGYREPYDKNWEDCTGVDEFIEEAKKKKCRSLCILGTGPGQILSQIKEELSVTPKGCEVSSYAFRHLSKNKKIPKLLKKNIQKMDMREYIKKKKKEFDFIYSGALEYLEEDEVVEFLQECSRKCRYLFVDCYFKGRKDDPNKCCDPWRKITRPYSWWKSRFLEAGFIVTKNKNLWKSERVK